MDLLSQFSDLLLCINRYTGCLRTVGVNSLSVRDYGFGSSISAFTSFTKKRFFEKESGIASTVGVIFRE